MQHQPQLPVNNNDVEDCLETPGGASEDSILSNLATRYSRNQVFSSLGSNAILAVNPKRTLESFSDACSSQYVTNGSGGGGGEKQQLAAHVFQLAERAFNRMTAEEQDQSIILMGDCASDKAQTRRLLFRQLCALSRQSKKTSSNGISKTAKITQNIIKAETILEAFGHAKTSTSSNHACFSRYSEFQYDAKGKIIGSKTLDYLLEKSRVIGHFSPSERNFNIFYLLLAGATEEERSQFYFSDGISFGYLTGQQQKGRHFSASTVEDKLKCLELRDHFKALGFSKRMQFELFSLIAAIMHLGNIQFADDANKPQEPAIVKNFETLEMVAELLGVSPADLELTLTYKTKLVNRDLFTEFLRAEDAYRQRDGLAMTLYSLLFSWILERINARLCKDDCDTFIGIVDFGCIDTASTSAGERRFDQLLVNYANDKLLQFVQNRLITEGIADLQRDGVISNNASVTFRDGKPLVEFLESQLLPFIDGESGRASMSNSVDALSGADLLQKCNKFSNSGFFISAPPTNSSGTPTFQVMHSIGPVEYSTGKIVDINLDILCPDFVTLFRGDEAKGFPETSNTLIRDLFSDKLVSKKTHWKNQDVLISAATAKKPSRQPSIRRKKTETKPGSGDDAVLVLVPSLYSSFKSAFDEMLDSVKETVSWYVFGLSPNNDPASVIGKFDRRHIQTQMSQMSICSIAEARIVSHDYSVSMTSEEFLEKFKFAKRNVNSIGGDSVLSGNIGSIPSRVTEFMKMRGMAGSAYFSVGRSGTVYMTDMVYSSLIKEVRAVQEAMKQRSKADASIKESSAVTGLGWRNSFADDVSVISTDNDASDYEDSNYEGSIYEAANIRNRSSSGGAASHISGDLVAVPIFNKGSSASKSSEGLSSHQQQHLQQQQYLVENDALEEKKRMTASRRNWLCLTWCMTWWIPSLFLKWCGGMKRKEIQIAWREKVTICILIFLACCSLLFFIIGLGRLVCPSQAIMSTAEVTSKSSSSDLWVYGYGRVYQINPVASSHLTSYQVKNYQMSAWAGNDISPLFYKANLWNAYCPGVSPPSPSNWDNLLNRPTSGGSSYYAHNGTDPSTGIQKMYLESMNQYAKAKVGWDWGYLSNTASSEKKLLVIYNNVYDVSAYFNMNNSVFGNEFTTLFTASLATNGHDATADFKSLMANPNVGATMANNILNCMNNMFYVGTVDTRNSFQCQLSNYILLAASIIIVLLLLVKFLAALQFGSAKEPEEHDRFVIIQVPCYTEGPESLSKTLESLALTRYDDKRKLIFVICDGMIIGSGNDRPTPRIVLDILGVDAEVDPEALTFQSLGEGDRQHNMGKVYSGLYEVHGHAVPFIVVVKVGKPSERQRPGNRGKRDSQMMLMRFLSRVHFNGPMNPLELEMYRHMKCIIGVNPSFYEYIMMVDADTEVENMSLNRMVSAMIHDSKIMGLCGETLLSNEKESWITMIQVYEYFISHHLSKAFESLFGSVTCLPGCFCMYRIRTPTNNVPLLVAPAMISDYSENQVDTLHLKNLLHLGEDRYLSTLMMKHFPNMKTSFTNDAICRTNAPDRWGVLLSQRRRWINSTVHNLFELLSLQQLCGFCCFSMRFVVFMDLFSTIVAPAAVGYIAYLVYSLITNASVFPLTSILMIAAAYGLQVIVFIIKQQYAQIGWMIVYLLAMPVFSLYIPVYSFWHFDDFSWGNTRVVVGEGGKVRKYTADVKEFNPRSIPLKKWSEFEAELNTPSYDTWVDDSMSEKSFGSSKSHRSADSRNSKHLGGSRYSPVPSPAPLPSGGGYASSAYSSSPATPLSYAGLPMAGMAPPPQQPMFDVRGSNNQRASMVSMGSASQYMFAPPVTSAGVVAVGGGGSVVGYSMPPPATPTRPPNMISSPTSPQHQYQQQQQQPLQPSDNELFAAVKQFLSSANLMSVTKKQVREELSRMFGGVDLTPRKATLNAYIDEILAGKA